MRQPKTRKILSENAKKQWEDPAYKEYMKNKFLEFYYSNEEYRKLNNERLKKAHQEYWSKKENRQRWSLKRKKFFEDHHLLSSSFQYPLNS